MRHAAYFYFFMPLKFKIFFAELFKTLHAPYGKDVQNKYSFLLRGHKKQLLLGSLKLSHIMEKISVLGGFF